VIRPESLRLPRLGLALIFLLSTTSVNGSEEQKFGLECSGTRTNNSNSDVAEWNTTLFIDLGRQLYMHEGGDKPTKIHEVKEDRIILYKGEIIESRIDRYTLEYSKDSRINDFIARYKATCHQVPFQDFPKPKI
jgi:hypothetical protein